MISGPGYWCYVEEADGGWYVIESAPSYTEFHGPYRWKWLAMLIKWMVEE